MIQLLLALPLCAAVPDPVQATQPPDKVLMAAVQALRVNDLSGYLRLSLTDEQLASMRAAWTSYCEQEPSAEYRRRFTDVMELLSGTGAEDLLMARIEPKLAEARPQMMLVTGMITGFGSMAIEQDPDLSQEQRDQARKVLEAIASWLQHNDVTDVERARRAVRVVCTAVRGLGIDDLEDVYSLSFEDALARGSTLLSTLKGVLQVYGLSADEFLDTIVVKPMHVGRSEATLRVSFRIFGIQSHGDVRMVLDKGRWVPEAAAQAEPAQLAGFATGR